MKTFLKSIAIILQCSLLTGLGFSADCKLVFKSDTSWPRVSSQNVPDWLRIVLKSPQLSDTDLNTIERIFDATGGKGAISYYAIKDNNQERALELALQLRLKPLRIQKRCLAQLNAHFCAHERCAPRNHSGLMPMAPSYVFRNSTLNDRDLASFALHLSSHRSAKFWESYFREYSAAKFNSHDATERMIVNSGYFKGADVIYSYFKAIEREYSLAVLGDVIEEFNSIFITNSPQTNLADPSTGVNEMHPSIDQVIAGYNLANHLSIEDIDLSRYFPSRNLSKAKSLVEELYDILFQSMSSSRYFMERFDIERVNTNTFGGKVAGVVKLILELNLDQLNSLLQSWRSQKESQRYSESILAVLRRIAISRSGHNDPFMAQNRGIEDALDYLMRLINDPLAFQDLLARVGIDPFFTNVLGKSIKELLSEFLARATVDQLIILSNKIYESSSLHAEKLTEFLAKTRIGNFGMALPGIRNLSKETTSQYLEQSKRIYEYLWKDNTENTHAFFTQQQFEMGNIANMYQISRYDPPGRVRIKIMLGSMFQRRDVPILVLPER